MNPLAATLPIAILIGIIAILLRDRFGRKPVKSHVPFARAGDGRGPFRVVDAYTGEGIPHVYEADARVGSYWRYVTGPRGEILPDPEYPDENYMELVYRPIAILYRDSRDYLPLPPECRRVSHRDSGSPTRQSLENER